MADTTANSSSKKNVISRRVKIEALIAGLCILITAIVLVFSIDINKCRNGGYGTDCTPYYGSVTDVDGNTYKTTFIIDREWMAENYRRKTGNYYYPNNSKRNIATYGLLYDWATATSKNFCPKGWHLALKNEFELLWNYAGLNGEERSNNLRANRQNLSDYLFYDWSGGLDTYGFSALPAG